MKRRLSASIDEDLLAAAEAAVHDGHAPSVSALVEDALRIQLERTHRLAAADDLFAFLDAERGAAMSAGETEQLADELLGSAEHVRPAAPAAPAAPADRPQAA